MIPFNVLIEILFKTRIIEPKPIFLLFFHDISVVDNL
jgi:hypothetical protein